MKIGLFYENVTVLDYAYLDEHLGVVGDALTIGVEFTGETDEEGVVYDFSHAKKKVKEIIDRDCDHRLVIPRGITQFADGEITLNYKYGFSDNRIEYRCPEQGVCEIPYAQVNLANLQAFLEERVLQEMPETVCSVRLELKKETLTDSHSFFHYTHGLKEHYGNCQRLFHGHRNTVEVFINGNRNPEIEREFAHNLFSSNIHFCYWENVVNKEEIIDLIKDESPLGRYENLPPVEIEYESSQGNFWGSVPGEAVYFMQTETTVENLSIHFTQLVKQRVGKNDIVSVKAFEGIKKGARTTL